jgi:uncharacterized membrane protein HdeD (DUF308 family)
MFRSTSTSMILIGVVALIAGVFALAGLAEFFSGFAAGETAGLRALLLMGGLVSVVFGVVLLTRPGVGAPRCLLSP